MQTHPTLYKRDSKGSIRIWYIEQQAEQYRYVTGLQDGTHVRSEWTTAVPASQSTPELQADFEVNSAYKHQLDRDYFNTIGEVDTPRFFAPMLAHKYEKWLGTCYSQPKLDGIRCIATAKGLTTREGQPITAVPHIEATLASVFEEYPDLILDGELYNHDLKDDFGEISSIVRKKKPSEADLAKAAQVMQYHIYDCPSRGFMNFGQRIVNGLGAVPPCIQFVDSRYCTTPEQLDALYGEYLEAGYEGQMVRLDKPYEQKRSKTLLKRKVFQDAEYDLVSIEEGTGNWAGLAKAVVCRLPDGRTFGAGILGNQKAAAELLTASYAKATIKFFQLTPDGIPRFGVATKFHEAA